jgi:hypothetical protein
VPLTLQSRLAALLFALALAVALVGCFARPLLSPLDVSATTVRPNGVSVDRDARISYDLGSRADVTVDLVGPDGKRHVLRDRATHAPDRYEVLFDGTVPGQNGDRRVLPDGTYELRVQADDGLGRHEERSLGLVVAEADTTPIEVQALQTDLAQFTPDGDGQDDEVRIAYRLTKDGEATVYVTDEQGSYFAIDPWRKRRASLQSHLWDGTTGGRVFGGRLLADGRYTVHVEARDLAGNTSSATTEVAIAHGGTPRLAITDVRFTPIAIVLGGILDVRITVKNTGTAPIHSWGPAPGYTYTAPDDNYASIRNPADPAKPAFFERRGVWRVGVTWQNAPSSLPLRWGLFPPVKKADGTDDWDQRVLAPGESVTVDGHVRVNVKEDSRQVRFSAGVVQEGVGFGERVGEQMVQVGY